jgi:16S rRNA (uracil1498-N3)-methyltransferase
VTHRFYVSPDAIDGNLVRLTSDQAHQIQHVLRLRGGDTIRVFDGVSDRDRIVLLNSPSTGSIQAETPHAAEPRTALVAYPALLSRDKFESVLQKLTEVGVACVVPVLTNRSLVREEPDERRRQRWQTIMREAAEQSGRGRVPSLGRARPFADAMTEATRVGPTLVAYERAIGHALRETVASLGNPATVSLFVGPEGGYADDEIALATERGAHVVTLGTRILRTETASPILAALVLYELGDLSSTSTP